MAKQKYMSIRTELGIKFISVVLFLIAAGFISIFVFKTQLYKVKDIDQKSDLVINSLELRANFDEMVRALKTMIIKVNDQQVFKEQAKLYHKKYKNAKKSEKKIEEILKFQRGNLTPETMDYYNEFKKEFNKFTQAYRKAYPLLKSGDAKGAVKAMKGQGFKADVPMEKFTKTVKMISENQRKEVMQTVSKMLSYILYGLIFVAIIALISILTFMKRICNMVNQIKYLTKAADAISMGKTHEQLKSDKKNELGDLTNSFERMRVSLEKAMKKLNK